jgi:tetratricopeptide (TPR) repeat protein
MARNLIFCIIGITLGFMIGFFFANAGRGSVPVDNARRATAGGNASRQARPLDPQQSGQLPPDHPSLDGSSAASSAQLQTAMDSADRNPRDYDAQMTAAASFYQARDFNKAVVYLNRALAIRPDERDALTGMGQTKYQLGDYPGAATYFEKVLAREPANADARASLGDTYFQRTPPDYDRAIAEYRKALNVDPKHEHALAALADTLLRKGDKAGARDSIDKLTSLNPSHPALPTLRSMLIKP